MQINSTYDKKTLDEYADYIEPFFYGALDKSNSFIAQLTPDITFNYFEYTLKKNPNNLSCHLQRIQLSLSKNDKNTTLSAICDLFIILGEKGLPLRRRLLSSCIKLLDREQINTLKAHLVSNMLTSELEFIPDNCFFKKTQHKLLQLHDPSSYSANKHEDVLVTADSYIENSQLETALEYIYICLEHDPENENLAVKLIKLYKVLNYVDEFFSAYNKFSSYSIATKQWDNAKQYFLIRQQGQS